MQQSRISQEKGFDPMLLRLGSITTTTAATGGATTEEEQITFSDLCTHCGSRKRVCVGPCFKSRKKLFSGSSSAQDPGISNAVTPPLPLSSNSPLSPPPQSTSPFSRSITEPILPLTSPITPLRRSISDPTDSTVNNSNNTFISLPPPPPSSLYPSFFPPIAFSSPNRNSPDEKLAAASIPQDPTASAHFRRMGSFLGTFSDTPKTPPDMVPPASSTLPPRQPVAVVTSPATTKTAPSTKEEEKTQETIKISKRINSITINRIKEEENANKEDGSKEEDEEEEEKKKERRGGATTFGFKCGCGRWYEVAFFD